jgi:hypothetical protein
MLSRKLLPAALLLLAAAVAAGTTTYEVGCIKTGDYEVDTTDIVHVNFGFSAISPVLPNFPTASRGNLIYSPAYAAVWDQPLRFTVRLDHHAPRQRWLIGRYVCTLYVNGTARDSRSYELVEETPEWKTTTITFVVPPTAAIYYDFKMVEVSKPLGGAYCASLPDPYTWPSCPIFRARPNVVTTNYHDWKALMVNGYRPGDVVEAYGVEAKIPDPWKYGIDSDVGTFSYVQIDGSVRSPDVKGAPVVSSVSLHMVGMPKRWGSVTVIGAQTPIYVVKYMQTREYPTEVCRPPGCIVLGPDIFYDPECELYVFAAAVKSGATMTETAQFDLHPLRPSEIRLPWGSVMKTTVGVWWWGVQGRINVDFGTVYPRVINSPTYYERLGENKKLVAVPGHWSFKVAFGVDEYVSSIVLSGYGRPRPYFIQISAPSDGQAYSPAVMCTYNEGGMLHGRFYHVYLRTSFWITPALYSFYRDLTGGRHPDLLHFLYGEPTTYRWGGGAAVETGMVTVRTDRYYDGTTADAAGSHMLYYVSGILPTDATALFLGWNVRQTSGGGGGNRTYHWLVWLVPTTACRSMFCMSLSPEVLGPLPPFVGDRALPNAGYSIMLMYIGEAGRHRVKIYVEDGYVVSSGPPINVTRARNYKLVEIDKEWRPFEAVVVGPGWWVPYRQLGPCETMPVNASSIYATPDRLGPVKIIVEDNGANSTYVFYVTNDVGYRITTRTPAPASITATPFNITAYVMLSGVPYYHAVYGHGEGGRLSPPACLSTWYNNTFPASQLMFSGDFWGSFGLANTLLKPVNIQYVYTKPRLELVEPWRGLVRVRANGPVAGFAFYAQRNGTWVKIDEVTTRVGNEYRGCILVNVSKIFPWDPILVLPLVEQELTTRPGDVITIWRPETALLFKTWADLVGYPKGARSELAVIRTC